MHTTVIRAADQREVGNIGPEARSQKYPPHQFCRNVLFCSTSIGIAVPVQGFSLKT